MDFDEFPDVDNLDAEVSFESGYRALRCQLVDLFEDRGPDTVHISEITAIANVVLKEHEHAGNIILATLKALLRDKIIKKVDSDEFCNFDHTPTIRSIDDKFAAYIYRPDDGKPKLPTKKQIVRDVARVARKFECQFTMGELAKEWTKTAPKEYLNALKVVFGISPEIKSSGKRIFLEIVQMLVSDNVIEVYHNWDDHYQVVKPKQERFRSLDDDWH